MNRPAHRAAESGSSTPQIRLVVDGIALNDQIQFLPGLVNGGDFLIRLETQLALPAWFDELAERRLRKECVLVFLCLAISLVAVLQVGAQWLTFRLGQAQWMGLPQLVFSHYLDPLGRVRPA
jgi:hypothetical protein